MSEPPPSRLPDRYPVHRAERPDLPSRGAQRSGGCLYVGALLVAVAGALVLPVWGVISVFASDACSPDSPAYFCSAGGQNAAVTVSLVAGPGALVAGLVAAAVSKAARPVWPYLVVLVQVVGAMVVSAMSARVS